VDSAAAAGIERNDDCNGTRQDGAGLLQTTTKGGRHFSAADAFLRPAKGRDELELVTKALVTRVVLERGAPWAWNTIRAGSRTPRAPDAR
jgi:choline dehydrogenase